MSQIAKFLLRNPGKSPVLAKLREQLLNMMLFSSFVVGTVLFGLALIPVLQKGLYPTIFIYSCMYGWTILITFVKRLPYRLRANGWLAILYIFGCTNLVNSGFNVDSGLFLVTFIAMAILLMDLPAGLVALVLGSLAVSILGFVNTNQNFPLPVGLPQSDPLLWIIGGTIFFLVGILLIYSLTIVVTGLEDNLAKATSLADELEQMNQSLRLSEARYRTLVETSPGLEALLDLNGNIDMINQGGLALFGYEDKRDVIGKNMLVFIAQEDQLLVAEAFQKILQEGAPGELECHGIRKDGIVFFAEFHATLVKDEAGEPQGVIGIGRDITERKETERILREAKDALAEKVDETTIQLNKTAGRLAELVKDGPTVVYSYRVSGTPAITYVSENAAALLGFEASEFLNSVNFWERIHPEDKERIFALSEQTRESERIVSEYRFLKKDGTNCWLRDERVKLRDANGDALEYIGSWSDITERKKTEEILEHSEAKYRSLYESMMDAYVSVDMAGNIVQFNHAFEEMLGYESDELRKLTNLGLTPTRWHSFESEIVQKQIIPRGHSEIYEKEYIRKDGSIFPVELRIKLIRDEAGNPSGMWAIVRDISGRKIIDQILRESEARYRELLDNSMQGVIVFQEMQIAYVNQAVTESLGYSRGELETLTVPEIIIRVHPDDRRMFQEKLQTQRENVPPPQRYPLRIIQKNGDTRFLEARTVSMKFQGKPALMTTVIDVSDIKKAEAEVQESERIQRTILNASDALVFLMDTNDVIISANQNFMKRMKVSADAIPGTVISKLLPENVVRARKIFLNQVISTGKQITFVDSREGIWFENNLYPILDASGKVVSVAVYIRDITEQRRVTEALRVSEEQYRTLAEAAHDMIFTITREGKISYVNSFGANFLGLEARELVGQPRDRLFPPDTSEHQEGNIQRVFRTGEAFSAESANIFPTRTVWLNTWLVPLKSASGEITSVLGVSRDITERKKVEEDLQQARDLLEERVAVRTNELLASQDKLRLLTAQTVKAQEEERRSISRELHDEAGQALITLKYGLAAIQSELPESNALPRQRLTESMKIIDQTMVRIRALAHSLRPPVLEIGGIHLSLQELCRELSERTQIPIYYQGLDIPGLPDDIGISLFRFVQEALTNILKHANASEVKVRLQYRKGEINLSVSDNGRGIEDTNQTEGLGLMGIRERLSLLSGRLEVHTQKGRGARLVGRVPWVTPAENRHLYEQE